MSDGNAPYEAARRGYGRVNGDKSVERLFSERPQDASYESEKSAEPQIFLHEGEQAAGADESIESDNASNEPEEWEYRDPSEVRPVYQRQVVRESRVSAQYYRRPTGQPREGALADEAGEDGMAFAPPPIFAMPRQSGQAGPEEAGAAAQPQRNIYQARQVDRSNMPHAGIRDVREAMYQVQPGRNRPAQQSRGKKRRRIVITVCICALIAGGAFWGWGWIERQAAQLLGTEQAVQPQGTNGDQPAVPPARGYDPAPENPLQMKTQQGITAVCGSLEMETVAVTLANVVMRNNLGDDLYDYYLFAAADGRLLGYYEGIEPADFLVQPDDCFYVRQPPYLLDNQGKALIRPAVYEQIAGEGAVLSSMENGWAILSNGAGTQFNYINTEGALLSRLWFCRAIPFRSSRTLAYVDTGNAAKPEERYALYVLSEEGDMSRWQYAADVKGLVGSACGLALMSNGDLIRLNDYSVLCKASEASAYLDCDALVVKEQETGKYGLFVDGEQHYDFAYDHIAPVACDIQWQGKTANGFTQYVVAGAKYPQPLSHYFLLQKDGEEEMVALSTRSYCPLVME
ncbi:MAG: hypothetical protein FWF86_07785 [Clostridia bacterium]|nr:hypothetical protein [Clostridia bacterium]